MKNNLMKKTDKMFLCFKQMTNVSTLAWVMEVKQLERVIILFQTSIDHSSAVQQNWNVQQRYRK